MSSAAQPMSPEVQELVNLGNEAQRAKDYEEALSLYQQAMEIDAENPVPQFGALMAAMATGNEELTDELTQRLQETSPELLAMLNPSGTMGGSMGGAMPANPHAGVEMGPGDTTQPDSAGGQ
jgi:tetratricopeptide (TPR) repeat protein